MATKTNLTTLLQNEDSGTIATLVSALVVDALTSTDITKPLSAKQGKVLKDLLDALGISSISGLQTALNAKAPLASPALTGTPSAPTPAAGDNTTKLATTAFVERDFVKPTDYATSTKGGTVKARISGSTLYLTINGATA